MRTRLLLSFSLIPAVLALVWPVNHGHSIKASNLINTQNVVSSTPDPVWELKSAMVAARPKPVPTTTTTTTVAPKPVVHHAAPVVVHSTYVAPVSVGGWVQPWACIAEGVRGGARYGNGESGGNPAENTGNGYWGGLQFAPSTWWAYASKLGITIPAYEASIPQQEAVANLVLKAAGWGQWPQTSVACGFR